MASFSSLFVLPLCGRMGTIMQNILSHVRRCVEDFDMISEGDRVAVGVSGGKDSLLTLLALSRLSKFYPIPFKVRAVSLDLGFEETDFSPIEKLCSELGVPFSLVKTEIGKVVFDVRKEENPCSLCSNMRRGALNSAAKELGCNKVALGHHLDDAVDTFLMSLIYEGRISCFAPVTYLDRTGITVIRPLLYCREYEIISAVQRLALPIVKNKCPKDKHSKRERVKEIAGVLREERADIYEKVFGAM
jgi:tRNA(Ile)-lysidine synthase TilS/MesJ